MKNLYGYMKTFSFHCTIQTGQISDCLSVQILDINVTFVLVLQPHQQTVNIMNENEWPTCVYFGRD